MSVQTTIIKCATKLFWPLALNSPEDQFTLLHVPGAWSTEAQLGSRYMVGAQWQISGPRRHKLPNKVTCAIGKEDQDLTRFLRCRTEHERPGTCYHWLVRHVLIPNFFQLQGEWLLKSPPPIL